MAWRWAAALALAGMTATPAEAEDIPAYLRVRLQEQVTASRFTDDAVAELRRHDRARDGLDAKDLARADQPILARTRANNLQRVLAFDLNGDLRVSAGEIRTALAEMGEDGIRRRQDRDVVDLAWFDANGDGDVTLREVGRAKLDISRGRMPLDPVQALMALPAAADGRLTEAELATYARSLFTAADANGDGVLSHDEASSAQRERPAMLTPRTDRACHLPPLPPGTDLVLIGVAEGGGPRAPSPNTRTATVVLSVSSGARPLYILAASGAPVRWELQGDVDRVARIVALTQHWGRRESATLVEGLDPPFAQVRSNEDCFQAFVDATSRDGADAVARATELLGRRPDTIIAATTPVGLSIPRGGVALGKPPLRNTAPQTPPPEETRWRLVGNPYRSRVEVTLGADSLSADIGCTHLGLDFTVRGRRLTLGDGIVFEAACFDEDRRNPAAGAYWNRIVEQLSRLQAYEREGRRLVLISEDGERLTFAPAKRRR